MSVQELNRLHRHYVELSDRFRSAWSFHKFLGSLCKVLMEDETALPRLDFQNIYGELKEVSAHLNAAGVDVVREKLDSIEVQLESIYETLRAEDSRIAPSTVRQFFRRVKNPDEKVLTQLAKFYLGSYPQDWNHDRLDKFDFLLTHLASESDLGGGGTIGSREQFRELLEGLRVLAGVEANPGRVAEHLAQFEDLRAEIGAVSDLDELHERHLIRRYRETKRRLGPLFFDPSLLLKIITTNLALGERIQELYRFEERAIADSCHEVFSLEQEAPVAQAEDGSLDAELNRFRREFSRFEEELQGGELKLDRLAQLRFQARSLAPRLRNSLGEGGERDAETSEVLIVPAPGASEPPAGARTGIGHLLGYAATAGDSGLRRVLDVLAGSNMDADPAEVVLQAEVFPLRLESREVVAYRRLSDPGLRDDLDLERFVLEAAALRVRVNDSAEEIRGLPDETASTGSGEGYGVARKLAVRADSFLRHFGHLIENAVLERREEDARSLQILRMRLMRDYSGLWLLAFCPSRITTRPELG